MPETEPARYDFDELTLWRTQLPDVQFAILPPASDRPNPRVGGALLFVSVFSPGTLYALATESGNVVWRRDLPYVGGSAVELSGGCLFTHTAQTLYFRVCL